MKELVKKSIRLPTELVEYVEAQKGQDFSKKLVNLLEEVRHGDADRKAMLLQYDELIAKNRKELGELRREIYEASEVLRRLSSPLSYAEKR